MGAWPVRRQQRCRKIGVQKRKPTPFVYEARETPGSRSTIKPTTISIEIKESGQLNELLVLPAKCR